MTLTMAYWRFRATFNISVHRGTFSRAHMFLINYAATSRPLTPGRHEEDKLWSFPWEKMTLICLRALLFLCITSRAWNNSTRESADTCFTSGDEWNRYPASPGQFLRLAAVFTGRLWSLVRDPLTPKQKLVIMCGRVRHWRSADTVNR